MTHSIFQRLVTNAVWCLLFIQTWISCHAMAQVTPPIPQHPQWILPNLHRRPVVAPPGTAVHLTRVEANIEVIDQIATTTLTLTMHNPGATAQEAIMVLPVAPGTVIRAMQYDGVGPEPVATLLPREKAREIYDAIVRASRDPAIVEFIGLNLIQTSAFPIPPRTSQNLTLTLEQALVQDAGRLEYALVRSNALSAPDTSWHIKGTVRASKPLSTIYSPSHALELKSTSANSMSFTLRQESAASGSVRLCILHAPSNTQSPSFTIFAYPHNPSAQVPESVNSTTPNKQSPHARGGFFMLVGNFPHAHSKASNRIKREVTLVIDRSGSMRGEKLVQAQHAAAQVLRGLDDGEYFNIIDYSDSVRTFAPKPVAKSAASLAEVLAYVESIESQGGTNIQDALLAAVTEAPVDGTLPLTLFLTDGLPTVGERNEYRIRNAIADANKHARRIFSFGVGLDVNTPLLSALSSSTRGTSTFILPNEDLEVKMSRVFRGLNGPQLEIPVLTCLDSSGAPSSRAVHSLQPSQLPDYFDGDQMMVVGRYTSDSPITLRVKGHMNGQAVSYDVQFDPASASIRNDYIPRIWATRRVAELIDFIRQSGAQGSEPIPDDRMKELTQEIVSLSTTYGILTEYTAFLAKEETQLHPAASAALRDVAGKNLKSRAQEVRSGAGAVNQEYNKSALANIGQVNAGDPALPSTLVSPAPSASTSKQTYFDENLKKVEVTTIRQIGAHTFYFREGRWIDARVAQQDKLQIDQEVTVGTDAYLELAAQLAADGQAMLLAQEGTLVVQNRGRQYLIKPAP